MWKIIGESVVGTSHSAAAGECQDAVEARMIALNGEDVLIFALSDGAGSATHATEAAKLTVEKFCMAVQGRVEASAELDLLSCCEEVRAVLLRRAKELQCPPRELSATLIAGVVASTWSRFVQIGDGAIVREKDGQYHALTWPDAGEFVNTTVFLVSLNWKEVVQQVNCEENISALAAFTDGLQELVLRHTDRSVHQPFFPGMMEQLRAAEDAGALRHPLRAFLASPAVNARTDDDKTLLLACRAR